MAAASRSSAQDSAALHDFISQYEAKALRSNPDLAQNSGDALAAIQAVWEARKRPEADLSHAVEAAVSCLRMADVLVTGEMVVVRD